MRSFFARLGKTLYVLLIALLLIPVLLPPFLDRIYYRGPATDHFDGERFFNAEGGAAGASHGLPLSRMARFMRGADRSPWPAAVPIAPYRPDARVLGDAMRVTWVGHATVLVQTQGLNIVTDPIWSDVAGPCGLLGPRRVRQPGIRFEDLPKIDLVLVSHNHYDHLDLPTLRRLWTRDRPLIVTSLGNDRLMRAAGVEARSADWGGTIDLPGRAVSVRVDRVHHWGSRWFRDRNRALWSGFTVMLPGGNLFFAGDTGFGDGRWPVEAARHGPVRLGILPIGAFLPREMMQPNHIDPNEAVEVFARLRARNALAIHWGTFQLSNEAIDAPPALLARTLIERGLDPARFRAIEAGTPWDVPALSPRTGEAAPRPAPTD